MLLRVSTPVASRPVNRNQGDANRDSAEPHGGGTHTRDE
jgi:hypothetical protein